MYLTVPVVVWLVGWFEWWVGVPLAVLLVIGLWKGVGISGPWRVSLSLPILGSLLAALAWVLLTPVSGLWRPSQDTKGLYVLLLEMGRGGWPTYLTDLFNDSTSLVSYYFGLLMVPAVIGRWLGPESLSWAFPVYIWLGVALLICVFTRSLTTLRSTLISVAVFVFFSGMGVLEVFFTMNLSDVFGVISGRINSDFYSWLVRSYPTSGRLYLFFQANSATLWWSPQHFIASGLVSLIIVQSRHLRFAAVAGLVLVVCVFWSPVSAVGLLPLTAALVVQKGIRPFLTWPNLFAAPLLAGLIAYFLLNDQTGEVFWLWQFYATHSQMLTDLMRFYLIEFILLAFVLWRIDRRIIKDPVFMASLAVLLTAPLFVYSPGILDYHYIMTRVAVPALVALAYFTSRSLTGCLPEEAGRVGTAIFPAPPPASRRLIASLIAVLAVGAFMPLSMFLRSTNHPHNLYEQVDMMFHHKSSAKALSVFIAKRSMATVPGWLQILLRDHDRKGLSIEDPIISSKYNVYLQQRDNTLIYLNRNCTPKLEQNSRFFLHIYPVDSSDLPLNRKQAGYEFKDSRWDFYTQGTDACIATFSLPNYSIERIVTGQYTPYLGTEWAAEYRFIQSDHTSIIHIQRFDPADFYHSYQQFAADNQPIIRSVFDIHLVQLHQNTLIYIKNNCTDKTPEAPFFLHIIPAHENDLPAHRRQFGFDNHDFLFNERGVIFDDQCLAVVPIPDYDIAAIRTGQFNSADGSRLWQEEVTHNT